VTVPIQREHMPNLPVHVVLMRGRLGESSGPTGDDAPYRPQTMAASLDLAVEPVRNIVKVDVAHPESARPGTTVDMAVTLKDDKGAPLSGKAVVFNRVSSLGGRLPFATVTSTAQGLAVPNFPIKAGDLIRMEAAFEGERRRQASAATGEASLAGGKKLDSLAEGLLSPNPQIGLMVILGLIIGGIWLTFAYVISLLAGIRSRQT